MVYLYVNSWCVLSRNLSPEVGFGICLCKMFVCVVSLFQPSSMASVFVYVKCLCVLSRYLVAWYMFMLILGVCCLVISAQL